MKSRPQKDAAPLHGPIRVLFLPPNGPAPGPAAETQKIQPRSNTGAAGR